MNDFLGTGGEGFCEVWWTIFKGITLNFFEKDIQNALNINFCMNFFTSPHFSRGGGEEEGELWWCLLCMCIKHPFLHEFLARVPRLEYRGGGFNLQKLPICLRHSPCTSKLSLNIIGPVVIRRMPMLSVQIQPHLTIITLSIFKRFNVAGYDSNDFRGTSPSDR